MSTEVRRAEAPAGSEAADWWSVSLGRLREWDAAWAEQSLAMTSDPWTEGILPVKFVELVSIGLHATQSGLNQGAMRHHVRAAIAAGASRQELLFVLKCASVMAIHACSAVAPVLLQEASASSLEDFGQVRAKRLERIGQATPSVEKMKAIGQWNDDFDSLLFLAPKWVEQYMKLCIELYQESVLPPKELELLLIAFNAPHTSSSGTYTRHHIKRAFRAGATTDEIMQVMKLNVAQRIEACHATLKILAEELEGSPR